MPFVPAPQIISQSEFGSATNVGYDGMKKEIYNSALQLQLITPTRLPKRTIEKGLALWRLAGCGAGEEHARIETMRRERRGRAKTREASEANPGRARFSTGAARRKQGKERERPRVSKGGPERRSIATRIADELRKSDRLMSGRER